MNPWFWHGNEFQDEPVQIRVQSLLNLERYTGICTHTHSTTEYTHACTHIQRGREGGRKDNTIHIIKLLKRRMLWWVSDQWVMVKCLSCKPKDLSWSPMEKGGVQWCLRFQWRGGRERWVFGAHWPASLAQSASFKPTETGSISINEGSRRGVHL